jgi:hypothetical protein
LSRPYRLNCVISFIFYLYLMLHTCVQRFDVMRNLKILAKFLASKLCLRSKESSFDLVRCAGDMAGLLLSARALEVNTGQV